MTAIPTRPAAPKLWAVYRVTRTGRRELLHSRIPAANAAAAIAEFRRLTTGWYRTKQLEAKEAA